MRIAWNKGKKCPQLSGKNNGMFGVSLKMSEETKRKISETNKRLGKKPPSPKGKKLSPEHCKKISEARKGIKFSEETRRKIGEKAKGRIGYWLGKKRPEMSGKKSYFWKGGLCNDNKYVSWIRNRRNRIKGATIKELGSHTFGEWENLKAQYGFTCPCCKKSEPEIKLTEDHIIPLSKGGSDLIENIQPLCSRCNSIKNAKIIKFNLIKTI
jgi:hypothetical protein